MKKFIFILILLGASTLYSMNFNGEWEIKSDYNDYVRVVFSKLEIKNDKVILIVKIESKKNNSEFKAIYRRVKGIITKDRIIFNQLWKKSENKWIDLQDEKWEWIIVDINIKKNSFYILNSETQEKLIVKRIK